mmetsp:Transcript_85607/g.170945  ORF Transcript_85607/g.170945 Transcript_85607/m.170945 type:complete len:156 (+) Transcript_85607:753-1220(+)
MDPCRLKLSANPKSIKLTFPSEVIMTLLTCGGRWCAQQIGARPDKGYNILFGAQRCKGSAWFAAVCRWLSEGDLNVPVDDVLRMKVCQGLSKLPTPLEDATDLNRSSQMMPKVSAVNQIKHKEAVLDTILETDSATASSSQDERVAELCQQLTLA